MQAAALDATPQSCPLKYLLSPKDRAECQRSSVCWVTPRTQLQWPGLTPVQNSIQVSHKGDKAQVIVPSCAAFPGTITGNWIESGVVRTQASSLMREYKQKLNSLCHNASIFNIFFNSSPLSYLKLPIWFEIVTDKRIVSLKKNIMASAIYCDNDQETKFKHEANL